MTDTPLTQVAQMAMDEFIRRYDQEGPFELIDGEIVPKMPSVSVHTETAKRMFLALLPYEQQGLGEVFLEATFVLTDNPQWVRGSRIPDVMFISRERITHFRNEIPDAPHKPYILIPDIAIEVVSPGDSYSEISQKVSRYLDDGVEFVWVVDPENRTVTVHRRGSNQQTTLSGDAILTGEGILPGFALPLAELFG